MKVKQNITDETYSDASNQLTTDDSIDHTFTTSSINFVKEDDLNILVFEKVQSHSQTTETPNLFGISMSSFDSSNENNIKIILNDQFSMTTETSGNSSDMTSTTGKNGVAEIKEKVIGVVEKISFRYTDLYSRDPDLYNSFNIAIKVR